MFEANVARTREALRQREALLDELEEAAEDSEEDAFSDADPEVYTLACAACERQLSRRAQSVSLVAEAATKLYSTDIPSADIREVAGERTIDTCECRICSVQCGACDAVCGYHVVRPCSPCGQSEHNGHFWLFHAENVVGTQRLDAEDEPMRWSALPYNGVEEAPAEEARRRSWSGRASSPRAATSFASAAFRARSTRAAAARWTGSVSTGRCSSA